MSETLKALGVDKMTAEERLQLIREIEDTLPDLEEVPLTAAQKAELQRRVELYKDNPKAGSPVEEVMARLRSATE